MVVLMAVETHEFLRIAHPRVQDLPATDSFTRKRPSSVIGEKCGLDMLAMAQGLTTVAGNTIKIIRRSPQDGVGLSDVGGTPIQQNEILVDVQDLFERGRTELNIPIYAGDVINVLRAGSLFVVGELRSPNEYILRNGRGITVTQAVAVGGGFTPDAKKSECQIVGFVHPVWPTFDRLIWPTPSVSRFSW